MRHATLFSGIGAPEIAADWLGWENAFHCEINPFCQQVLNYWFSKSESYEDITKTDFKKWSGQIDVLTGGFPCQPFSVAGKRKGAEDNRYLWPEFKRVIREVNPSWVIGENVGGIISMVQPGKEVDLEKISTKREKTAHGSTNGQEFVVETICKDLEQEGYTVQPIIIPACAVGAPHRRDRVWFIAHNEIRKTISGSKEYYQTEKRQSASYSFSNGQYSWCSDRTERPVYNNEERQFTENISNWAKWERGIGKNDSDSTYSNSSSIKREYFEKPWKVQSNGRNSPNCYARWEDFPTQSAICGGDDGISYLLDTEAIFKGVSFSKRSSAYRRWRTEAIKAYGNAMVPQVIYEIYRYIDEIENGKGIKPSYNYTYR